MPDLLLYSPAQSVIGTCSGCHQGANPPAGVVESGMMPPGGKAALNDASRAVFLQAIAGPMIAHEESRASQQGRAMLRRLNRHEYENTLRDILSAMAPVAGLLMTRHYSVLKTTAGINHV